MAPQQTPENGKMWLAHTPLNSPIQSVREEDGSWKMVVDYHEPNQMEILIFVHRWNKMNMPTESYMANFVYVWYRGLNLGPFAC